MDLLQKFQKIRAFVFDVDGVLTDGNILVLESGEMARTMNTKDGYALQLAIKQGYKIFIVSGSSPSAVEQRLNKLGINEVYFQVNDKKSFVAKLMEQNQLIQEDVLFMGDDVPDLQVFQVVSLGCCPADAVHDLRNSAAFISAFNGGGGCVREVIEKVLRMNNHWNLQDSIAST